MDAGSATKQKGSFRLFVTALRGFDFEGGHDEEQGHSASGELITVPLHRHEVSLDVARIETELEYSFRNNWDVWFRVPYEIKERDAKVRLVDAASDFERKAMQRHLNLHHKEETLRGFSDFRMLVAHRINDLLREGDALDVALGTSIPIGETENDPFTAGAEGLEHEHIQFGSGTFDPLLELYYTAPLSESFSLGGFAVGRFPYYENRKSYRGPIEVTAGPTANYKLSKRLSLQSNVSAYFQDFAHWDGERDINSGVLGTSGTIGAAVKIGRVNMSVDVRYPFTQETLSDEGDTFKQGPTVLFNVFYSF